MPPKRTASEELSAGESKKPRRRSARRQAVTNKKDDEAEPEIQIESFSEESLGEILHSVQDNDELREKYANLIAKEMASGVQVQEYDRLVSWHRKFMFRDAEQIDTIPPKLATRVRSLGFGSMAGKSKENTMAVDEVIKSCPEDGEDRKGLMLSHFFYRKFLTYIYNDLKQEGTAEYDHEKGRRKFKDDYDRIWQDTNYGCVKAKRNDGNTHEPCATSILGSYINCAIQSFTGSHENSTIWSSEFTLFGSGAPKEHADGNQQTSTSPRKGRQPDEGLKQPRCDGILMAPDPLNSGSLRALAMMEAKIDHFDKADDYQSRSNAIDAFARQPTNELAWPLLVFRCMISKTTCFVEVFAVVPDSAKTALLVPMWKPGSDANNSDSLYNVIMASVLATKDFRNELSKRECQLDFCEASRNVAIDDQFGQVFKSFFNTERRSPNLSLIQTHVDADAEGILLGSSGSYIKMKDVGLALPEEVDSGRFVKIGKSLAKSHADDICHGDVRIDNMMLDSGTLIDWDLAGKAETHKYPSALQDLVDGARHPAVRRAISNGTIGELRLSKEHDWFSLKAAMKFFKPKDELYCEAWESLIDNIQTESELERDAPNSIQVVLKEQDVDRSNFKTRGRLGHQGSKKRNCSCNGVVNAVRGCQQVAETQ